MDNCIIVGIIPGPREPKGCINTYFAEWPTLPPTFIDVSTSQTAPRIAQWTSTRIGIVPIWQRCHHLNNSVTIGPKLGCTKCIKPFFAKHFGSKAEYGEYDVNQWPIRTNDDQRHFVYKI